MPTVIDLGSLGSAGFLITGDAAGDAAGFSISSAGDVNGDGFDDFIIGAPFNDSAADNAGAAYVIFGKASGLGSFDLTNLQASQGFKIEGAEQTDWTGWSVAAAGDVNGDGFDDVLIGASVYGAIYGYYAVYGTTAHAYVIFGKASGFGTIDLATLPDSSGFVMTDEIQPWGTFSVSGAGDVNGDGFDDIIIGSDYDNGYVGAAYLIFGKASGFGPIDLNNLAPGVGIEIEGDAVSDFVGHSVSAAGDVNGDGFDDLIIGAPPGYYNNGTGAEAYVIFGKASLTNIDLTNLTGTQGFAIQANSAGNWAGAVVTSAGDFNGDGYDDILVAAQSGSLGGVDAGEAYIIFGKATGFGTVDLSNLGSAGVIIQGDVAGDWFAESAAAAGDVNGDGFDDLIIGAPYGDNVLNNSGEAYVIFGRASSPAVIDITNFSNSDGIIIQGFNIDQRVAWSVGGAGDINGDGYADLLVGNPFGYNTLNEAGSVYVIFGDGPLAAIHDVRNDFNSDGRSDVLWRSDSGQFSNWLGQLNGGFVVNDANAFALVPTNWDIAGTGDFDGDGNDDVLWRSDSGQVSDWLGNGRGGFLINDAAALTSVPTSWHIVGTGDFNGDERDDILWRSDSGQLSNWLGRSNGGFTVNDSHALTNVPTNWHVAATGDFNGDGRDDILWRSDSGQLSDWLGTATGGWLNNDANAFSGAPTSWHIAGTGDFNGDGRDDILWRSDSGQLSNWLATASGGFIVNDTNALANVPIAWQVAAIGDYNGDGRDDILWRSDSGQLSNWLGTAVGGFSSNDANAFSAAPTSWHTQPDAILV